MTRPTEPTDLAALAALLDGATGGEWETDDLESVYVTGYNGALILLRAALETA